MPLKFSILKKKKEKDFSFSFHRIVNPTLVFIIIISKLTGINLR